MYQPDEITYELFGINPTKFYATKFLDAVLDVEAEVANKAVTGSIIYQKTDLLISAIRECQPKKVLDLGCGSGNFGARIKYHFPEIKVYGIDLSEQCARMARKNQYDDARAYDVLSSLPYEDHSFDFIFSMDFFGHIQFKDKGKLVNEIHRVTQRGGYGFHGIETGFIDYLHCNPNDKNDIVRKYVWEQGHIGVELLEAILERFRDRFEVLYAYPFPLSPFYNVDIVIDHAFWGQDFNDAVRPWLDYNAKVVFDNAMGYCNKYFMDLLIGVFGRILTEEKLKSMNIPGLEKLVEGHGFSFTFLRKI